MTTRQSFANSLMVIGFNKTALGIKPLSFCNKKNKKNTCTAPDLSKHPCSNQRYAAQDTRKRKGKSSESVHFTEIIKAAT